MEHRDIRLAVYTKGNATEFKYVGEHSGILQHCLKLFPNLVCVDIFHNGIRIQRINK